MSSLTATSSLRLYEPPRFALSTSFACCKAPKRIANGSRARSSFHQDRKPPNGS
jgi:hypothetical protein